MPNGKREPLLAYFSMEIALESGVPNYSGGLGVLSGDTLRSAADMALPMVAVSLLYRKGYFIQRLDARGQQTEDPVVWNPKDKLELLPQRIKVQIEGRDVTVAPWKYVVKGNGGHILPVILLDTALPENAEQDRGLTDYLYGGDGHYRLCQEVILGMGGVKMLREMGHRHLMRFHMNEGHAALCTIALLEEKLGGTKGTVTTEMLKDLREKCVYTTHTPVPAGHDSFPADLTHQILGAERVELMKQVGQDGGLNMSTLALKCSSYTNAVALKHAVVSRTIFPPGSVINSITNGVHIPTWASGPMQELFDRKIPGWREDPLGLRYMIDVPDDEVWAAHMSSKKDLVALVKQKTGIAFNHDVLTLGFARRMTDYKRPTLLFEDLARLKSIAKYVGPIQILYAGKAHPRDDIGKSHIRRIFEVMGLLKDRIPVAFLEGYDMEVAKKMVAGVDVWVNTPRPPLEASGTSGMKAAVNGVPSLSVRDGWWMEGHIEEVTGWAVGEHIDDTTNPAHDSRYSASLYNELSKSIMPMFYEDRPSFLRVMKNTVALNASHFNTHRMVAQYVRFAYRMPKLLGGPEAEK
jgi:starch phosphorylase